MMTEIRKDNVFKTKQNWFYFSFFENKFSSRVEVIKMVPGL